MKDDLEREKPDTNASVWGRGGEGPHAFVESPVRAKDESAGNIADGSESPAVPASPGNADSSAGVMVTADDRAVRSVFELAPQASPEAVGPEAGPETGTVKAADSEPVARAEKARTEPRPISPNDVAIGYTIPLAVFFLAYLYNWFIGGYCFESEKVNAIFAVLFAWTPALIASCLLLGNKNLKLNGAILILPAVLLAIFGGQYFHFYERFVAGVGPYGPLARSHEANGWQICDYESMWMSGEQTGTTYTREKVAGPGIRYVRKMFLGEPP